MTTEYLLVDISLFGMLSVVMVNDYNDFQHKCFSGTEQFGFNEFQVIKWLHLTR